MNNEPVHIHAPNDGKVPKSLMNAYGETLAKL